MKKFTKCLICIVCLLLCLMILVGCQFNSNSIPSFIQKTTAPSDTSGNTIQTEENTMPTTITTEPVTIQIETVPPNFNITLSFAGDCMLASERDKTGWNSFNSFVNENEPSYFLEKVRPIFEADDFTIVNLENVFTDQVLPERAKNGDRVFWYKSKTSNVDILTSSSVEGVSLANNHTYDYGEAGYHDTLKTVTEAGLNYGINDQIIYFEKEGFTIAVICSGLWSEYQTNDIVKLIETASNQSDYQVVFYHGGTEKLHKPEDWKIDASRKLVDNGADLVIGNHPHVLQPREVYNGVEIVYSLGNFCYGGHHQPENRTIIYQMNLTVDKDTLSINNSESTIIPCYVYTAQYNNYQPAIIENEEEIGKVLDFMEGLVDSPV